MNFEKQYIANPPHGRSADEVVFSIVAYRYLQCATNASIKQELNDAGATTTTYRLRIIVGEVEEWLGLAHDTKSLGRTNLTNRQSLVRQWRKVNGHPTLEQMIFGWEPIADWRSIVELERRRTSRSSLPTRTTGNTQLSKRVERSSDVKRQATTKLNQPPKIDLSKIERPEKQDLNINEFLND